MTLCFIAAAPATSARRNEYRGRVHAARAGTRGGGVRAQEAPASLPDSFSWMDVNGTSYLTAVLNQHLPQYCGSCWAFASLSALQDRIKIQRGARGTDVRLSMQHVLNCGFAGTCNGGNQGDVYAWIHDLTKRTGSGVAYDTVNPYIACSGGNPNGGGATTEGFCANAVESTTCTPINVARSCSTMDVPCTPLATYPNATISAHGTIGVDSGTPVATAVHEIMKEVYEHGPVACGIDAGPIETYSGGVVTKAGKRVNTDHVVSIVGWGTSDDGIPYWHARNSWGESWGEMGFFRIARGQNLNNIETECAWATPGTFTAAPSHLNTPCSEDGANCLPKGYDAHFLGHAYGDEELDTAVAVVQSRSRDDHRGSALVP